MPDIGNVKLTFWSLEKADPPSIAKVRHHLIENGLIPERAIDVPQSTAFRRACDSFKTKELLCRYFKRKSDDALVCQFDLEIQDEGKLRRKFQCQYRHVEDSNPVLLDGDPIDGFDAAYEHAMTHYTGSDISKVIQEIIVNDGLGAYSPKKNGGVYFVPVKPEAADLLAKIERFAASLSVRFLVYSVPDTTSQRAEIAEAIAQSFADEIALHAEAISGYSVDTRVGVIDNRRAAIHATNASMMRLRDLMNERFVQCREQMRLLLAQLAGIEAQISDRIAREVREAQERAEMDRLAAEDQAIQQQQDNRLHNRRNIVMEATS